MKVFQVTLGVSNSPDYVAGDVIDGVVTLTEFGAGGIRLLRSITAKEPGGGTPALKLLFFRDSPSGGTYQDNAALAWGSGDMANLIGVVTVAASDWVTLASKSVVSLGGIDQGHEAESGSISLIVVADATFNASADITLEIAYD